MTTTATARGARTDGFPGSPRRLWWLVAAGVVVAVVGVVLSVVLLVRPELVQLGTGPAQVGDPVRTSYGTFTVTNASTTFVPDTQGPPSQAQHNGSRGSDELQVWVRFANTRWDRGLRYSPAQFRLVGGVATSPRRPDGSTLQPSLLPQGASIDGQVWFDLAKGQRLTGAERLQYTAPGGHRFLVALGQAPASPAPSSSPSSGHGH